MSNVDGEAAADRGRTKPVVTHELVRSIEARFADNQVRNVERRAAKGQIENFEVRRFGETVAVRVPGVGRGNHVICFCDDDLEHLDDLAFYDTDVPTFYLSPAGFSSEVGRALAGARFYQDGLGEGVLFGWDESGKVESRSRFGEPGRRELLARFDGEPAGTGVLTVRGGHGALGPASVVPGLRGRGCHTALIHARLHLAHQLKCEIVHSGGSFGSTSFRNQQRAGLRLAYVESV